MTARLDAKLGALCEADVSLVHFHPIGVQNCGDVSVWLVGERSLKQLAVSLQYVQLAQPLDARVFVLNHLPLALVFGGHLLDSVVVWQGYAATGRGGAKLLYLRVKLRSGSVRIVLTPPLKLVTDCSTFAADFLASALHSNADFSETINH